MKITIFTSGVVLLVGCIFYSLVSSSNGNIHSFVPINVGYFLVIAAAFLGTALCRDAKHEHSRVRYEVYRQLSRGGMEIDDLMEALAKELLSDSPLDRESQKLRSTVTSMLDDGILLSKAGTINLAEQIEIPNT
jgi:hypothetical protein